MNEIEIDNIYDFVVNNHNFLSGLNEFYDKTIDNNQNKNKMLTDISKLLECKVEGQMNSTILSKENQSFKYILDDILITDDLVKTTPSSLLKVCKSSIKKMPFSKKGFWISILKNLHIL